MKNTARQTTLSHSSRELARRGIPASNAQRPPRRLPLLAAVQMPIWTLHTIPPLRACEGFVVPWVPLNTMGRTRNVLLSGASQSALLAWDCIPVAGRRTTRLLATSNKDGMVTRTCSRRPYKDALVLPSLPPVSISFILCSTASIPNQTISTLKHIHPT